MLEQRENTLLSEENKLRGELAETQELLDRQLASKNSEIERLLTEQQAMQSKLSLLSARAQEAEAKASQLNPMLLAIDTKNGELAVLSVKNRELQTRVGEQTAEIEAMTAERDRLITNVEHWDRETKRLTDEANERSGAIEKLTALIEDREETMTILKATHRENIALLSEEHRDIIARQSDNHKAEIKHFLEQNDILSQEILTVRESARAAENLYRLEHEQMLSQIEVLKSEMEQKTMEIERLSRECDSFRETISALTARTSDAEARRLEAYEFARISSDTAYGLRRELETLKRDLAEALDSPRESLSPIVEHRHRDIVESMARLFPGTEATRYIARDPQVERVSRMALELLDARAAAGGSHSESTRMRTEEEMIRLREQISTLQEELDTQKARAEQAEAFASDWHEQIMTIRNSASWRWAKRLRALGRPFKG
ncbi:MULTISPECIES: hypothetical protein [Sphingobium]|uniref:hypothetical protein n=1 Tax=Sphingobium TaxID=165695 RepID=UPI00159C5EC0|nr:hypothetical protein [Sphingobium sp. 15-1]